MCSCPDYQKTQNKTHHWEPSQTTAMIPTLPEDVLILILEDFALPNHDLDCPRGEERKWKGRPRQCLTTLYNACLVSRALHRISCPILYRGFSDRTLFRRGIVPERLEPAQLLRTICSRPEYGQALRSLSITTWAYANPWDDDEPFGSMQSDTTLLELLQSRAKSCWIGDNDTSQVSTSRSLPDGSLISELLYSIEMDSLEAHIAMLLLLCPKLKTLELRTPSHFEDSMVARLLDATLSRGYQTAKLPQPIQGSGRQVSDRHISQAYGAPRPTSALQKSAMLQDLVSCTIQGAGAPPSGLKFFKNLISLPSLRHVAVDGVQGGYGAAIQDLMVDVLCPQVETLHLQGCQLLTNEASSIIKCCPNLLTLEMTWNEEYESSNNDASGAASRLRFGDIGDSIARHTPKLTSLCLSAYDWLYRYFTSKYPYTIGKRLQQLEHLKSLQLDHHMIYGMQHLDELDINHTGDHADVPCHGLSQIVPKGITYLKIEASEFITPYEGSDYPVDEWQDWQIKDLNDFLQDKSFERLSMVDVALGVEISEEHVKAETVTKHGWKATMGRKGRLYCELENRGCSGVIGPQYLEDEWGVLDDIHEAYHV